MYYQDLTRHAPHSRLSQTEAKLKRAEDKIEVLNDTVSELRKRLKEQEGLTSERDRQIQDLMDKLGIKEARTKQLTELIWKPKIPHAQAKPLGKPVGAKGFHRLDPTPEAVTEEIRYESSHCPDCGHGVIPSRESVFFAEDIVFPRPTVTKHTVVRSWCSHCRKHVRPEGAPTCLRRIGVNTLAYLLFAREVLDTPIPKLATSLSNLFHLNLSEGEITAQLQETGNLLDDDYHAILSLLRQASFVNADETGARVMGENWWNWTATSNGLTAFAIHHSRGKGAAKGLLGTSTTQVRVTDGLGSYQDLPGPHQLCWVHLLRAAKEASPVLLKDLQRVYRTLKGELARPLSDRGDPTRLATRLQAVASHRYRDTDSTTRQIQAWLLRQAPRYLTALAFESVPPENNPAERALRPEVIKRKISGSMRSLNGAIAHQVNASVVTTYRNLWGGNFLDQIIPVLTQRLAERA